MTTTTGLFTLALVALVIIRFLLRELRDRRIPLDRIWIVPAFVTAVVALVFALTLATEAPFLPELVIGCIAGILVGAGVGIAVDSFTALRLSDDGKTLIARGSLVTVGIWVAALLLRLLGRFIAGASSAHSPGMIMVLNTSFAAVIAAAVVALRVRFIARVKAMRRDAAPAIASPGAS